MDIKIHPWATTAEIEELAFSMRQSDKAEIWKSSAQLPHQALYSSVKASTENYVGLVDGSVAYVIGVCAYEGRACVWLVGTDKIQDIARTCARHLRRLKREWKKYGILYNYIDPDNALSVKLLEWMEARFIPVYFGAFGERFWYFEIGGDD